MPAISEWLVHNISPPTRWCIVGYVIVNQGIDSACPV